MNFVSPHHIFCAYPDLMFQRLSLINPAGPIYLGHFVANALCKYNDRGFCYVNCTAMVACTTNAHSVTDNEYFWMDLKQITYMNMSAVELMASYHAVDIHCVLGGRICGVRLHDSFVFPHVQLIEDHPYSTFLLLTIITNSTFRSFFNSNTFFTSFNLTT